MLDSGKTLIKVGGLRMRALGIVLAGGNSRKMGALSHKRAISAMPIAGSYRSIDFVLSNMSNSHIQKVAVITQYNSRSLHEHLSSSKWWDFGRKQGGLLHIYTDSHTGEQQLVSGDSGQYLPESPIFKKKSRAICSDRDRRLCLQDGLQ